MNYISKLDYLGFIPKKGETEEKFIERAEKWMSLEDKLEYWASKNGYIVLDNTKPAELIYKHTLTKPTWVPLIEKKHIKSIWTGGCCECQKIYDMLDNSIKVPVAFVTGGLIKLMNQVYEDTKAHEMIHVVRWSLTGGNFLSELMNTRELMVEEMIANIVEHGEEKYFFPYTTGGAVKYTALLGAFILGGSCLWMFGFPGLGIFLLGGGGIRMPSVIQQWRAIRLAKNLKDSLPKLEEIFKDKTGYLMLRTKPTELVKIAKNPDYVNKIQGLRGEIIRKHL